MKRNHENEFSSVQNAWKNATNNIIPTLQCNDMNIMKCEVLFVIFIMIGKKSCTIKPCFIL